MSNATIEQIEVELEDARSMVGLAECLERLRTNPDFSKLILNEYLREEAVRLVELKAAPAMRSESAQEGISRAIDAIGGLQQFFIKVQTLAQHAEKAITDAQEAIAEELAQAALDEAA